MRYCPGWVGGGSLFSPLVCRNAFVFEPKLRMYFNTEKDPIEREKNERCLF